MKWILLFPSVIISLHLQGQAPVKNFTLTNITDGTSVSLDSYGNCSGLAVIFSSNVCPYDGYYSDRLKKLITDYQGKIQFLLVNSYQEPEENPEKMKAAYDRWGISAPYLADKNQDALNSLGAKKSPEVFLIKRLNNNYVVVYNGAIDDNPQAANAVTESYLKEAMDMLLSNGNNKSSTRAVGCSIRKK